MQQKVDFTEFREVLQLLENTDVAIRCRALGEPWRPFTKLILLSDSAMILQGENDRKIILNIRNIIEFELERSVGSLQAACVYEVAY